MTTTDDDFGLRQVNGNTWIYLNNDEKTCPLCCDYRTRAEKAEAGRRRALLALRSKRRWARAWKNLAGLLWWGSVTISGNEKPLEWPNWLRYLLSK